MQATVSVPEREYELRSRQLAGEPHDDNPPTAEA
jgi:hypothetical protein